MVGEAWRVCGDKMVSSIVLARGWMQSVTVQRRLCLR